MAHSRSPRIHALFAAQLGHALVFERIDATPAQFAATTRGFFAAGGRAQHHAAARRPPWRCARG
ncbi:MAG: hypothetical protein U1F06_05365 [Steroidobacteraceae bacterium]